MEEEKETEKTGLTLNGRPVTRERLDEQIKLAEKTGAKLTETKPGQYKLRLDE